MSEEVGEASAFPEYGKNSAVFSEKQFSLKIDSKYLLVISMGKVTLSEAMPCLAFLDD